MPHRTLPFAFEGQFVFEQFFPDLVQRLGPEILELHQLVGRERDQFAHRLDVGVLQAVQGTGREFQVVQAHVEDAGFHFDAALAVAGSGVRLFAQVQEEVDVPREDAGAFAHRFVRFHRTVGPDVEHHAIVFDLLSDAHLFSNDVNFFDRGEDGIDRNVADRQGRFLVPFGRDETFPSFHDHFHAELPARLERGDLVVGIGDLDLRVVLDVPGLDLARAFRFERDHFGHVGIGTQDHFFKIEDDLQHVFHYVRNGGKFVRNVLDPDARDRRALQMRQQDPPQGVAQRRTVTSFQRLHYELAIARRFFLILHPGLFT